MGGDASQPVFGFRCGSVVRWYDQTGEEVSAATVAPCGAQPVLVPVQLTMIPQFFGDGPDPLGENMCNFSTMPDVVGNWVPNGPACLDPPSPSGASNLQWTPGTLTSLTFEYGNPPRASGGVVTFWNTPQWGAGDVSWPTSGLLAPGDVVVSNPGIAGRRVRLTYLSGPAAPSSNAPHTVGTGLRLHLGSTEGTTPATRIRFDFLPS